MDIDYSDITNGIFIFLLSGLSITLLIFTIVLLARLRYLKKKIKEQENHTHKLKTPDSQDTDKF